MSYNRPANSEFERVFSDLEYLGLSNPNAKSAYNLLRDLTFQTDETECELLVSAIKGIRYSSNTTDYFYFFFPIVSHTLFYKSNLEGVLLQYLIGPNFANGTTDAKEMIEMIAGAMTFKLKENQSYLTKEGKEWVVNILPSLKDQVERQIQVCWKELDE